MSVTQNLSGLGSWDLRLREATPQHVRDQLGLFGHVVVVDGPVDVDAAGDGLLAGARYAGVCRGEGQDGEFTRTGSGLLFWLGDEDGKGHTLLSELTLTNATLTEAVTALLPPTVTVGTVHPQANAATRYSGKHIYQSRREALSTVLGVFDAELRVNPNFTVDVGTAAQLYNTEAPDRIIVRRGARGGDIGLTAISGRVATERAAWDYSTDVTLLGQTVGTGDVPGEVFVTGSAAAASVPYKDPRGNPVKLTRLISESSEGSGSVTARARLQLNRFNRVARSVKVTADDFITAGSFRIGDAVYVYDPDSGIVNAANEVTFQGQVWHPDVVRVAGDTWPLLEGMTVAWRTDAGVWLDLTPWVVWETPGDGEITVGDLPRALLASGGNPVLDRVDAARDSSKIPKTPTGLALTTTSALAAAGSDSAVITASWNAVTQNTDNTVVALGHYEVQYRPQFRAPQWFASPVTSATTTDLAASAALVYDVQVRAVSTSGKASDWSPTVSILSASDAGAPGTPSDPTVSSYLGQLRIAWNGLTALGGAMPADFNRVDVHVSGTTGFVPSTATLVSSLSTAGVAYATAPYGAARFVKLVAYDHNENASAPSGQVSGSTTQVVSSDVFDGAIGTAKLADAAIVTAKIADLAVNDAKIGNLSVGKLTAGTMSADVTVSGRFATALTGARVEMNSLGFQKFAADNTLLVSITGSDALLTGVYKTALTGRRIEAGAGGNSGRINFLAPDDTNSYIAAFTATTGQPGTEAIRMAVKSADSTIWGGWGALQVEGTGVDQSQVNGTGALCNFVVGGNGPETTKRFQVEWASDRGTTTTNPTREARLTISALSNIHYMPIGGFFNVTQRLSGGGTNDRIAISDTQFYLRDNTSLVRGMFHDGDFNRFISASTKGTTLQDNDGSTTTDRFWFNSAGFYFRFRGTSRRVLVEDFSTGRTSPLLKLINADNFGANLYYKDDDSTGTNPRLEVGDAGQTILINIHANGFVVGSSAKGKTGIRKVQGGALDKLRRIEVVEFTRTAPTGVPSPGSSTTAPRSAAAPKPRGKMPREVGVIIEQVEKVAPELAADGSTPGLSLAPTMSAIIAAIQELATTVDGMRQP